MYYGIMEYRFHVEQQNLFSLGLLGNQNWCQIYVISSLSIVLHNDCQGFCQLIVLSFQLIIMPQHTNLILSKKEKARHCMTIPKE